MIDSLDTALQKHMPDLYASLQPGIDSPSSMSKDLASWFRWRNGQLRDTKHEIHGTYRFISLEEAKAELRHLRATVWKSPLNAMILAAFARRSFYSLPILTDVAGDGYCYNLLRRNVFYRFKGEQDINLVSFAAFVELLTELVSQPSMAPGPAAEFEHELLQRYSQK